MLELARVPIAVMAIAITVNAASASTSVKPAAPAGLGFVGRDNFHPSREPIDADLKANALARKIDRSSAGHAGGKEIDRRAGRAAAATLCQDRIEADIVGQLHDRSVDPRSYSLGSGVERRGDRRPNSYRCAAIAFQQGRDVQGVAFEPRP